MDQVFLSVAAGRPDTEAVVDVRERVTYGDLLWQGISFYSKGLLSTVRDSLECVPY